MVNVVKITKLHFSALYNMQFLICASVLLLHVVISFLVIRLADTSGPAGTGDFIAMIWMIVMGLIFFAPSFRYTLSLGISRKTYFLAGIASNAAAAVALVVVVAIFYSINLQVANVWMIYDMVYQRQDLGGLILWEFASFLFLGMLGWFIRLAYYNSNRNVRFVISVAPFVLAGLLILFNALVDGAIGRAVLDFFTAVMGLADGSRNPFIGTGSLLAAAVILSGPVFLLLRRAQINE